MLTTDEGAVTVRQMRDLGSFAVRLTVPLLARIRGGGDEAYRSEAEDLRSYALNRPREASDVPLMNVYRVEAWLLVAVAGLGVSIPLSAGRPDEASAVTSVIEAAMVGVAVFTFTCLGMMIMSFGRYVLANVFAGRLRARLDGNPDPRPGLVGWLTVPNSMDLLPALVFMACFAPEVFP